MRKMRALITALAVCALLGAPSQPIHAGGSSKSTVKIHNRGTTTDVLAIIVDPPANALTDFNVFLKSGGRFLQSNQSTSYSVSTGTHTVAGVYIQTNFTIGNPFSTTASPGKGKTANVWVAGDHTTPLFFVN